MPVATTPNYSHHNPAHRDSVIGLADAVCLLWPGARVNTSHAGPTSAWVQSVRLPFGPPPPERERFVIITLEWNGWEAREMRADAEEDLGYTQHHIPSAKPSDLIAVIHDAFAYIHSATTEDR